MFNLRSNPPPQVSRTVFVTAQSGGLQLGGADYLPRPTHHQPLSRRHVGVNFTDVNAWLDQDSNRHMGKVTKKTISDHSPQGTNVISRPLGLSGDNVISASSTKAPGRFTTKSSSTNRTIFYSSTQPEEDYIRLGSRDLEPSEPDFSTTYLGKPISPGRATGRKFGCEIDRKAIVAFPRNATVRREIIAKKIELESDMHDHFKPTFQPIRALPRLKIDTATKPPPSTKPPFSALYAKRPTIKLEDIPDTISADAYEAYHARAPTNNELICSCRKPAHALGLKIAQCANKDCAVGWYHYTCLDKSEKLKANFGTMVCQPCRVDKQFKEQDEKMAEKETGLPFTGRMMRDALPAAGGVVGVSNPYGLGVAAVEEPADLTTAAPASTARGALGSTAFFGYQESRPHVLTEAYTNAQAYVNNTADDYEYEYEYEYDHEYDHEYDEDEEDEHEDE